MGQFQPRVREQKVNNASLAYRPRGRATPSQMVCKVTPKATPSYKDDEDDEWKIFSRRKSYSSGGGGEGDGYGQHRMSVTTSSSEVRRDLTLQ